MYSNRRVVWITEAPSHETQRGGDRHMETCRLAGYRKTPVNSALIRASATKAASCSFRTPGRLRLLADGRQSFVDATSTIGFRSFLRSRSPRRTGGAAHTPLPAFAMA